MTVSGSVNPLDLKYVKVLKNFVGVIGAWPGEALGERVPFVQRWQRKAVPIIATVALLGQIYFIFKFYTTMNFFLKGSCYVAAFLGVLTAVRTTLPQFKTYGVVVKRFIMSFHLIHFRHKDEYYEKVYNLIDKVSYYFTLYSMALMVGGMCLFNVSPMYQNFKMGVYSGTLKDNSTPEFSVYYAFPGFNPFNHFKIITIINFYLSNNCAISVCAIDLLLSIMVFQIIGHVLILRNNLKILLEPQGQVLYLNGGTVAVDVKLFSPEENEVIREKLAKWVDHHRLVVSFTEDMSEFFGPMLAINYLYHLVCCCLLLLECSQGDPDALFRFGPLTLITFGQLIQISITFEIVDTVSEKLKDAVYGIPWECMDVKNCRTVGIILNRVQIPIRVMAMGMTQVGVTTMAGILKTTFSYFTFLRSMA